MCLTEVNLSMTRTTVNFSLSPCNISFEVKDDFSGTAMNPFDTTRPLVIDGCLLSLAVQEVMSPLSGVASYTVDYYLNTVLRAFLYRDNSGRNFRLRVERENWDLRRVLAEAFGMAAGILLVNRDFEVDWRTVVPIYERHIIRPRHASVRRRPDIIMQTKKGTALLECKGTTAYGEPRDMLARAYKQVKKTRIGNNRMTSRFLSCALVPLTDDTRDPIVWCGDPDHEQDENDEFLINESVVNNTVAWHYIRVANMSGLTDLGRFLLDRCVTGEPNNSLREAARGEIERADNQIFKVGNREALGRKIELSPLSTDEMTNSGTDRVIGSLGLDVEIANDLVTKDLSTISREDSKIQTSSEGPDIILNDGACLSLRTLRR